MKRFFLLAFFSAWLPIAYAGPYMGNCLDCSGCGCAPCSCSCYLEIDLGGYRLDAPGFAFGEILGLIGSGIADIPELEIGNDRVDGFYPRVAFGVEFPSPCNLCSLARVELSGFYYCSDRDSNLGDGSFASFAFPTLDGNGDFLLGVLSSFSGVSLERDYQYSGVGIKFATDYYPKCFPGFAFSPFLEFDFDALVQDYQANVGLITGIISPTTATIARQFSLEEELKTYYYDFGLGFDFNYIFCNSFMLFGQAAAFASAAQVDFKGTESTILMPTVTTIRSEIRQHMCKFNAKERGQLGIGYRWSDCFIISVVGQVEHWGLIPRVNNPHRVASIITIPGVIGIYDQPAKIQKDNATNYAGMLKLIWTFGK